MRRAIRSSSSSRFFSAISASSDDEVRGHAVEGVGQLPELVFRQHGNPVREVALPHALGAHEQLVHRPGDGTGERETHERAPRTG